LRSPEANIITTPCYQNLCLGGCWPPVYS